MRHDRVPRSLDDWIDYFARRLDILERAKRATVTGGGGGGSGTVTSVTAGDSTITVGGTSTDPTVAVNAIAESKVTNLVTDLSAKAPIASPTFTGNPAAPTPTAGDNDTSIATTAFVTTAVAAGGGGTVTSVTAGDSTITIGGTGSAPTVAVNTIAESKVTNLTTDLAAKAPLASPTFTGNPTAPTPSAGDNDTSIATTAFVTSANSLLAPLASPALTGNPTAPTASVGDNDTSIATTAFVTAAVAARTSKRTAVFKISGTLVVGTGATRLYNDTGSTWTLTSSRASVETAPSGGSVTVDINKNGTTVFTTQSNRPTITTTNLTSGKLTTFDVTTVADGDYLTVDVDVITAPAADLSVIITYSL